MLAVLMSMKPEWWEKILTGEKRLEIRKSHPQSKNHADPEWPLTVLVYVSGTGAVQGQFLCPGYAETNFLPYLEKPSCVPLADLEKYAGGKCLPAGWCRTRRSSTHPARWQSSGWTVRPCRGSTLRHQTKWRKNMSNSKDVANAVGAIAEMAWIFYTAIRNAGADVPEAAMLTREYLIASIHGKSNDAPEDK